LRQEINADTLSHQTMGGVMATTQTTLDDLLSKSEPELEALFRSSPPGEIPAGDGAGTVLAFPSAQLARNTLSQRLIAALARWLVWQGKVFDASHGELVNKVSIFNIRAVRGKVYRDASWFDGHEAIILDYSKTSFVAQKIRDEVRQVAPGLYLGLLYWERTHLVNFALAFTDDKAAERKPAASTATR
jgi:hypothetical protein